jgi:hypothetical protein
LLCRRQSLKKIALFHYDIVTFLDVIDLGIVFIHLVLDSIDLVLVGVSEFFILRPCGQAQINIVKIFVIHWIGHFHRAGWDRECLIDLIVAGVSHFFEGGILCIVPSLKQHAQIPSVDVPCGKELVHLILDFLFKLLLEFFVVKLEKLLK